MEADYMLYSVLEEPCEDEEEIMRQMEDEEAVGAPSPPPPRALAVAPAPALGSTLAHAPGAPLAPAPPRVVVRTSTRNVVYAEALE